MPPSSTPSPWKGRTRLACCGFEPWARRCGQALGRHEHCFGGQRPEQQHSARFRCRCMLRIPFALAFLERAEVINPTEGCQDLLRGPRVYLGDELAQGIHQLAARSQAEMLQQPEAGNADPEALEFAGCEIAHV